MNLKLITAIITLVSAIIGFVTQCSIASDYLSKQHELEILIDNEYNNILIDITSNPQVSELAPRLSKPIIVVESIERDLKITTGEVFESADVSTHKSIVEDYGLGMYRLNEAPNVQLVLAVLKKSIEKFITKYNKNDGLKVKIVGHADGTEVLPESYYKGDLGTISEFKYFSEDTNEWSRINLLSEATHLNNELIAFLRAYDVLKNIENLSVFYSSSIEIHTSTSYRKGGKYRKIVLIILIKDILSEEFEKQNSVSEYILNTFLK